MRILIVPDVPNWAIGHLAQVKIKYNPHHVMKMECVHPRDAGDAGIQANFEKVVKEFKPDIIHFEYYRSAQQLIDALPFLKTYKLILTHHNQRDKALGHCDWVGAMGINHIVTHTEKCKELLVKEYHQPLRAVSVINHGIDLDYFQYSNKEPKELSVGYAGRVVPWKGLKEVTEVSKELGYPVMFMGKQDKMDYWNSISQEGQANINFSFMECEDDDRLDYYRTLGCYVGNSKDGYEEGTLEYLEAMACGVPVITTLNGVARDIAQDGKNCLVVPFEDKEALKEAIKKVMEDKDLRQELRKNGWNTVKNMTEKKMAYEYSNLYHEILNPDHDLVSVIIPTYNRAEQIGQILKKMNNQTYPHIEVIICDDNSDEKLEDGRTLVQAVCDDMRKEVNYTLKYLNTKTDGYNLAMARNMGAIEAEGETLVFIDSRMLPDENAVLVFSEAVKKARTIMSGGNPRVWFFGNKGAAKQSFVENFSAVKRNYFLKFGMFCERIDKYGGLSQETRIRWANQGGEFNYLGIANAAQLVKGSKDSKRRQDIIEMKLKLFKMYGNERA